MMLLPWRLLLLLLLAGAGCTEAQTTESASSSAYVPGRYAVKVNPAVASLLIVFTCGFFFLGLFSIYLRRCATDNSADNAAGAGGVATAGAQRGNKGLELAVLETFPTMAYAKAMELKPGKEALECAVCLSEFNDDDILRLLPGCCHVFHADCIDAWLESHVTCPVCRLDLSDPSHVAGGGQPPTIEEGIEREGGDLEAALTAPAVPVVRRWHSTGHETFTPPAEDRYTLRLPENVRMEFLKAGRLRGAESFNVPAVVEASGNRDSSGRSGRWGFLLRTFSVRRRYEGPSLAPAFNGSSKRVFPSVGGGDGAGGESESRKQHDDGDSSSSTAACPTGLV